MAKVVLCYVTTLLSVAALTQQFDIACRIAATFGHWYDMVILQVFPASAARTLPPLSTPDFDSYSLWDTLTPTRGLFVCRHTIQPFKFFESSPLSVVELED